MIMDEKTVFDSAGYQALWFLDGCNDDVFVAREIAGQNWVHARSDTEEKRWHALMLIFAGDREERLEC